jgi:G3E family GTPase
MNAQPIQVTDLIGLIVSRKTTLLNHILRNREGRKVIVSDKSKVIIDAELCHTEVKMVETSNFSPK